MSNDFWRLAGKTFGKAQQTMDEARKDTERFAREARKEAERLAREAQKETERFAREAQKQLDGVGMVAKNAAGQVTQGLAETVASVAGPDSVVAQAVTQAHQAVAGQRDVEPVDFTTLPEHQRVAFAGALFALADADGEIDKDELQLIFEVTNLDGLSAGSRQTIQRYIIEPPVFNDTLAPFEVATEPLRCALMLNLFEVALANDLLAQEQAHLLLVAQHKLRISDAQYRAIQRFVKDLRHIRLRGLDDNMAAEMAKNAAAGLPAVGVPIAAVYLSGSVMGLSAAGITSGLAAVGLGLGMVPGIGVAVLLGTGIFMGVRWLLDGGQERQKERLRAEAMRKAQLVIQNLQEAINLLIERMQELQHAAADAEANREAIRQLTERMRALQQIIARRKEQTEALQ